MSGAENGAALSEATRPLFFGGPLTPLVDSVVGPRFGPDTPIFESEGGGSRFEKRLVKK